MEKMYLWTCAPNEDTNQSMLLRSLIGVFIVQMKKLHPWLSKVCPVKNLSDLVNVLAGLNLCWLHTCMSKDMFSVVRLSLSNSLVRETLTIVLLNLDIPYLFKQCRSRSVGFFRSQPIWICAVCHSVPEFIPTTWMKLQILLADN